MSHTQATQADDDVRPGNDEAGLENATAARGGQENVNAILKEAKVVGGSDNTALPAGANGDGVGSRDQLDRVADSESAKNEYQSEEVPSGGSSSA